LRPSIENVKPELAESPGSEKNYMTDRVFLDTNIFAYAIDTTPSQISK
jgi:hypothetical protein